MMIFLIKLVCVKLVGSAYLRLNPSRRSLNSLANPLLLSSFMILEWNANRRAFFLFNPYINSDKK